MLLPSPKLYLASGRNNSPSARYGRSIDIQIEVEGFNESSPLISVTMRRDMGRELVRNGVMKSVKVTGKNVTILITLEIILNRK